MAIPVVGGGILVGAFLSNWLQDIDHLINDAGNIGKDVLIEAGDQTRKVIEQAQIAFNQSLNIACDKVDAPIRRILYQIDTLARGVITQQQLVVSNAMNDAQGIVDDLMAIIGKPVPRLTTVTPKFVSAANDPIHLTFIGNFPLGSGEASTLEANGRIFTPLSTAVPKLEFEMPYLHLFPQDEARMNMRSVQGKLKLPYEQGTAIYSIFLRSLPSSPGSIELQAITVHKRKEVRRIEQGRYAAYVTPGHYQPTWHLCSCKESDCRNTCGHQPPDASCLGKNNDETREFIANASPGWTIVPDTSFPRVELLQGEIDTPKRTRETENQVGYTARTEHIANSLFGKESGSININISFQEQRVFDETKEKVQQIALQWGNSNVFSRDELKDKCNESCLATDCTFSWKVTFIDFRGGRHECNTTWQHPYLTVTDNGPAGIHIEAPALNTLSELQQ